MTQPGWQWETIADQLLDAEIPSRQLIGGSGVRWFSFGGSYTSIQVPSFGDVEPGGQNTIMLYRSVGSTGGTPSRGGGSPNMVWQVVEARVSFFEGQGAEDGTPYELSNTFYSESAKVVDGLPSNAAFQPATLERASNSMLAIETWANDYQAVLAAVRNSIDSRGLRGAAASALRAQLDELEFNLNDLHSDVTSPSSWAQVIGLSAVLGMRFNQRTAEAFDQYRYLPRRHATGIVSDVIDQIKAAVPTWSGTIHAPNASWDIALRFDDGSHVTANVLDPGGWAIIEGAAKDVWARHLADFDSETSDALDWFSRALTSTHNALFLGVAAPADAGGANGSGLPDTGGGAGASGLPEAGGGAGGPEIPGGADLPGGPEGGGGALGNALASPAGGAGGGVTGLDLPGGTGGAGSDVGGLPGSGGGATGLGGLPGGTGGGGAGVGDLPGGAGGGAAIPGIPGIPGGLPGGLPATGGTGRPGGGAGLPSLPPTTPGGVGGGVIGPDPGDVPGLPGSGGGAGGGIGSLPGGSGGDGTFSPPARVTGTSGGALIGPLGTAPAAALAAGTAASAGALGGSGFPPFIPPMGGLPGAGGDQGKDRERRTWLVEDAEVWGTAAVVGPTVIGRDPVPGVDTDSEDVTTPARPADPARPRPGQTRPVRSGRNP